MITDIYTPIDEACETSLNKIQTLADSDVFLAGLGQDCKLYPVPVNFPVITDVERSMYLLTEQTMWEEPEETRVDQFYADVANGTVQPRERYDKTEHRRRREQYKRTQGKLFPYLDSKFADIKKRHNIVDFLCTVNADTVSGDRMKSIIDNVYLDILSAHIYDLITGAFNGGFETWPVNNHFYECYKTGGITAGWVGPLPKHGGIAQDCMQLLHYGPKEPV